MDIQHVSSGNMMAPMLDSPPKYGRDQKYVYKKSSYQYSNTDGNIESTSHNEQNVNQLDALLEDLKNEREQTREKVADVHTSTTSYKTIEPTGTVTKTTRIIKSHQLPMEVENISEYNSYNLTDGSSSSIQDIIRNDMSTYKSNKSISKNINTLNNVHETTSASHSENSVLVPVLLENDSKSLHLSDDILPIPGTKVTTTVRTYTYEIPADHNTINNRTVLYKNNVYNSSKNELISEPNLPQTVVYSSESYNTSNGPNYGPNNSTLDRHVGVNSSNRVYEINDSQEYNTQRNEHLIRQPNSKTIVYNINRTENNTSTIQGVPSSPNNIPSHTLLPSRPQQSPHHPNNSTNNYYYRESTNTVNTISGPPVDNLPPNVTIEYSRDNYGPRDNYVPQNTSNTVTYNYSSTMNSRRGPNDYSPTSQPPPFPVDGVIYPDTTGQPPAKLNELLNSFGEDNVDSKVVDTSHRPKREIETALATTNQQTIPSVNKAGPAVYYPPGHEWLTKKEESMAGGYSASGKYAKASGMYEYESGYKSKSSSKSGAAVVPVCLPLCCAMPCSIM